MRWDFKKLKRMGWKGINKIMRDTGQDGIDYFVVLRSSGIVQFYASAKTLFDLRLTFIVKYLQV